jgi:hypothetical protein
MTSCYHLCLSYSFPFVLLVRQWQKKRKMLLLNKAYDIYLLCYKMGTESILLRFKDKFSSIDSS